MKRLLSLLQRHAGTTRNETIVVLTLLCGLVAGTIVRRLSPRTAPSPVRPASGLDISRRLDSLAASPPAPPRPYDRSHPSSAPSTPKRTSGTVNINMASITDLQSLPGIGKATAERILERRRQRPFRRIDELMDVRGIGEKKFERMRPFLAVQ
ncbi:MAG: helix-hairpin-helix domain-containing protein ['Candidatus Kapabacteria' thiocyanatum]|uniref:Helix-hairpin-helix DNA-binding motif class 1 domain-containing protein n=1 Tax=Candidatus Kapaibacterium thiocyanatum TaxID=1895771 RepID=A0A1M3L152_9BACT|nr:helix-hairpin-helix domain-containing protein ['Candidatus Kapabacteria' thiocyanatum]OJX58665.1 MAG: hypothetical protein BGO89_00195 ['Candidatus Kapabacteria' thiocyanatum]